MSIILILIIAIVVTFITMSIDTVQKMKNYQTKADDYLLDINFLAAKRVPIDLVSRDKLEFLVDNNRKQFAILSCKPEINFLSGEEHISKENFSMNIFNFSDIINFELLLDNDEIIQGRALAATGGTLLFGVAGAIIGSSGKRKITKANRTIVLNIYLNRIDYPVITINFPIIQDADSISDVAYNKVLENAHTIKGILHYAQQQNKNIKTNKNNGNDIMSKIQQLNELKDQKLISEEEFNKKRKELLDNL